MNKEELAIFIGNKIRQYRKARGLLQAELAEKIGVTKNTISNYETGFRSPKKDTLFDLADSLGVSIDDLFPQVEGQGSPSSESPKPLDIVELANSPKDFDWSKFLSAGGKPITERDKATIRALFADKLDELPD